jgi:predicted NUDIX family phosphoesterase
VSGDERVLAVPRTVLEECGLFHGFTPLPGRYLPRLLDPDAVRFLPRSEAEHDPTFKQLIPYVVLRCRGTVFHYTRGGAGTEARLRALRSLGIGGHVCAEDGPAGVAAYHAGLRREVTEEILLETTWTERTLGLINDDRTPVGQVHLGVVHVFDLAEPRVRLRDAALEAGGLAPLAALRADAEHFETWSRFLLDGGWLES